MATLDEVVGRLVDGRRPKGSTRAYDAAELRARAVLAGVKIDS
jgi:hypothetical protein